MLLNASVLLVGGIIILLLPLSAGHRARLGLQLAKRAHAHVPAEQVPALQARMTRRARGTGAGIMLAGLVLLVIDLVWPGIPPASSDVFLILSLLLTSGAAGLALVEIWRPGVVTDGPRAARMTTPGIADYVPALARVLSWVLPGLGFVVLLVALVLGQTSWFDAGTLLRSPVPLLAVAIPAVVGLSRLAVRRVLDAAQPARDAAELYWQDAVRADTLSFLLTPPALIGLFGLVVSGSILDDAASAAAMAAGQVGPTWTLWLLIAGYVLPLALLLGALLASPWSSTMRHFRARLWPARSVHRPAGPVSI